MARENARLLGVEPRFSVMVGDWGGALSPGFDLIVSNPPYIGESERNDLSVDVRDHDPAIALFAGETGLAAYRQLIPQIASLLAPGGWTALEIGTAQAPAVRRLMQNAHFSAVAVRKDMAGHDRVVIAQKAAT